MDKTLDWTKFLLTYEAAVEELKLKFRSIRSQLREAGEYSPIEFATGRVKRISSILEKAQRLGIPLDKIEEQMEDIAGIRIMCQFTDDIYTVADLIKMRDGKEFDLVYEKDYIENPKPSGYKSYHMIIRYPVFTAYGERDILVEIQIRTMAMNFWATIEHSLNYKFKTTMPENLKKRLKNAAEAAHCLDEEMAAISADVKKAQMSFSEDSNTVRDIIMRIKAVRDDGGNAMAEVFETRFTNLKNQGDIEGLDILLSDINQYLLGKIRYQFSNGTNSK